MYSMVCGITAGLSFYKVKQIHTRVKQVLYLKKADEVGEDEEGGGAVDPLQEAEEDEGTPVDDEPRGEDCLHSPY